MISHLEVIKTYAEGSDEYYLPDMLYAMKRLNEPIDYELCARLIKKLDDEIECYGVLAKMLVSIFIMIKDRDASIDLLSEIISFTPAVISQLEKNFGHLANAKGSALDFLSTINSDKARIAVANAIKYSDCASAASTILSKNCAGCESILVGFCKDGEWFQKRNAVKALAGSSSKIAEDTLCSLIKSKDVYVAEDAIYSLGNFNGETVLEALREALNSENTYLTGIAAISLAKVGGANELVPLHKALKNVRPFSAENLVQAIAIIGTEEAMNILIECLSGDFYSDDVILYCVKKLGELKVKSAVPDIINCLKHRNRIIRLNSIKALMLISPEDDYSNIVTMLEGDKELLRNFAGAANKEAIADIKVEKKTIEKWKLSAATIKNDNGDILYLRSTTSAYKVVHRASTGDIVYTYEFIDLGGVRTKYREFLDFIINNKNVADVKLPNGEQFKIKYTAGKHGGYTTSFVKKLNL